MRKILILLLVLVTAITTTSCGNFNAWDPETSNQLIVGMECDYAPFNWLETESSDLNHPIDGTSSFVNGYDVWIAKEIAEELGVELVIKKVDWDGLIPALRSGRIDLIIAGMSPTTERKRNINFTNSYYDVEHVIITQANGNFANATQLADLANARIMGQKGTVYDRLAKQLAELSGGNYQSAPLDTVPFIVTALSAGTIDITIVEKPVAQNILANHSGLVQIDIDVEFELEEEDRILSIGVHKKNTTLLDLTNQALSKISSARRLELMNQAVSLSAGLEDEE